MKIKLAFSFIVLTLVSCHKDNTRPPITGKWFMISVNEKFYQEDKLLTDKDYQLTGTGYYEFLLNDSLNREDDYGNKSFTTYSYNTNNNKLTTQDGDDFTVVKLTSGQLTLQRAVFFLSDDSLTHSKLVQETYFKK